MERTVTLTPDQISFLRTLVEEDRDRQHYTPAETLNSVDQETKDRYDDIITRLSN